MSHEPKKMDTKRIIDSDWGKRFRLICPSAWEQALKLASQPKVGVDVYLSDETGECQWVVEALDDPGFWLDAFPTQEEALELCKVMGWQVLDEEGLEEQA